MSAKRILVCGTGSIGKRHISNLLDLGANLCVWRNQPKLLDEIAEKYPSISLFTELSEAIEEASAVVVATATDQHLPIARQVLESKRPLFLEKPISHQWQGVEELLELGKNMTVEVGCQMRSHPCLTKLERLLKAKKSNRALTYRLAMGHRLDAWRPDQDYKESYSSKASRGGGALFDLIHQIDLALWFFGPVQSVQAVLSSISELQIEADDVANLLLKHESGLTGHIQLDMCSPVHRCEVEIITSECIYSWSERNDGSLKRYDEDGESIILSPPSSFTRNTLFINQMKHFLARLDDPDLPPLCSLPSGSDALNIALSAREAYESKTVSHFET